MAEPPIPLAVSVYDGEAIAARDDSLRMDLEHGLRFTHVMGDDTRRSVYDTAVTVLALLEELKERGAIDVESYAARLEAQQQLGLANVEAHLKIHILDAVDKYALECPPIPCEELIPLCRGRCCTLHFPLSKQDLGERVVKWNYMRPYLIRQRDTDLYCVHNDPETHGCGVYHNRPAICRTYDCREDKRIWIDYEKRIPAVDPKLEPKTTPVPTMVFLD